MELRAGFKHTEIGAIPDTWTIQTGEQLTTLIAKGASPRWQGFTYTSAGMLFITSENVRNGHLDLSDPKFLPLAFHEKLARTKVRKDDILLNLVGGSIGRSCLVPCALGDANVNQAVAVFRTKLGVSAQFLAYCLQAPITIERILEMQVDAARPNISLSNLREFKLPFPPALEQRAIAGTLSDVDALLDGLERLIAKKRDLKQVAMQQLLTGGVRLPGFRGDWLSVRLEDLGTIQRGASPRPIDSPAWFDDGSPVGWVRISDVTRSGVYLLETVQRLSSRGIQNSRPVKSGSLIMSICATIGRPAITQIDVCIHDGFVVFEQLKAELLFLYYALKRIEPYWSRSGQTGSQMNLNTNLIKGTEVLIPPTHEEQSAIAMVLSDMDAELSSIEQRLTKTRALKQAMMQELLTGRTRLI